MDATAGTAPQEDDRMDGITAIAQRVAAIEATLAPARAADVRAVDPGAAQAVASGSGARFDELLSTVLAGSTGTGSTPVAGATGPDRTRTVDGVPGDLAAYGNGKIPRTALQEVGTTGHRLWAPAGQALEGLLAEAARDGVRIGITDSYRSYDAQVDVAARKGLYSQGGLAAEPGTSPHGWGIAVDLDLDDRAQAWMRTNGGRFGFVEDTPREPWHWVYRS